MTVAVKNQIGNIRRELRKLERWLEEVENEIDTEAD